MLPADDADYHISHLCRVFCGNSYNLRIPQGLCFPKINAVLLLVALAFAGIELEIHVRKLATP